MRPFLKACVGKTKADAQEGTMKAMAWTSTQEDLTSSGLVSRRDPKEK
jgi:hypothetical protein